MFTKIKKIEKFAVFNNFDWDSSVRDDGNNIAEFKDLNILYGRNYSGKTTLSRIFRSIEKGELHEKYPTASFEFDHTGNDRLCQLDVNTCSYDVRVYNKDFVDENLKWLIDENGTINPFAILGQENVQIEKQINEKEEKLGSEDEKKGLRFDLKKKSDDYALKRVEKNRAKNALDKKLKDKANQSIKTNPIYQDVNYNITKIKSDISKIIENKLSILDEKDVESKKNLLKETNKANIQLITRFNSAFNQLYKKSEQLVSRDIKPSKTIQELIDDALLQEWVRNGIGHHKGKRDKCAFCGADLPDDLWDKLNAHFSKESETLREDLKKTIEAIYREKLSVNNIALINQDQLYSVYHEKHKSLTRISPKKSKYIYPI